MGWIDRVFRRRRLYADLSEEMRAHLEEKREALVEQGMTSEQAAAAARREFGSVAALEQSGREAWQWPTLESFLFDIRFAFRQLRQQPSFAIVAIFVLARRPGGQSDGF